MTPARDPGSDNDRPDQPNHQADVKTSPSANPFH